MRRHLLTLSLLVGTCAGLAACDGCAPQIPCDDYPGLCNRGSYNAALRPATDCDDMLGMLQQSAIETMRAQVVASLESALSPQWCGPSFPIYDSQPVAMEDGAAGGGGAQQYSTTNNQEAGVDEADFVKNDASTVYLLAGDQLKILDVWPPEDTHELSSTMIEGRPHRLFVQGARALVYSDLERGDGAQSCAWGPWYACQPVRDLKITVLDIADPSAPVVVREIHTGGSYVNARRLDNAVHTVVAFVDPASSGASFLQTWPSDFDPCFKSTAEILDSFYALFLENRRQILERGLGAWMPELVDRVHVAGAVETRDSPFAACQDFYAPNLPGGSQVISVLSLDLDDDAAPLRATSIAGQRGTVYASRNNLYLATAHAYVDNGPWFDLDGVDREVSMVHRFALDPEPVRARYTASGTVPGRLLNQFALGEYEGFLRLATTTGQVFGDATNGVYVLEPVDGRLDVVGQVTGLAPSEDIRSARFLGDRGFVVTFKKTDPLFTLDLSDPRHPRVVGELHIPGFSTYLHPMDATHLLTIGFDAQDEGDFAWFQGLQLQIFDVSDLAHPSLTHKTVIGTRGSSSEATANHLAFTYFAPKDLLALPMVICDDSAGSGTYGEGMSFAGLLVYDVTVESGFAEHGRVPHPLFSGEDGYGTDASCWAWWQDPQSNVKRSIVMDDYVLSLSNQRLKINHLDNLGQDLVNLAIPPLPSDEEMMVW